VLPRLPLSVLMRGNVHLVDADRIVGGTVVTPNSLPFQITLQRRSGSGYSQSCGGSILSESVILNAAHCVSGYVSLIYSFQVKSSKVGALKNSSFAMLSLRCSPRKLLMMHFAIAVPTLPTSALLLVNTACPRSAVWNKTVKSPATPCTRSIAPPPS
jgi:hypothetical protein